MKRKFSALVAVLFVLLALGALVGAALGSGSRARFPSSFAGEPEGLMAFRRLLDKLGTPTEVLDAPWHRVTQADGVLVVATPLQRPVTREEKIALEAWLVGGGRLLVIDDATVAEETTMLEDLLTDAGLERSSPSAELDLRTFLPKRPETGEASGTSARPAGTELERILLHTDAAFGGTFDGLPLAINGRGAVLAAEARIGQGRIVRVLGPILARDQLLLGDNLEFALRLVEDLRDGGPVRFDEFHHGFGGMLAGFQEIERSTIVWALIQGIVVIVVYGFARGIRFGPPRIIPEPLRRSSLEFVHSMASLYRRAGHRGQMLRRLLERFAREARTRWALEEGQSVSELGRSVARRAGLPERDVLEILQRVEQSASKPGMAEKEMLIRARELVRLEKEVFGAARATA